METLVTTAVDSFTGVAAWKQKSQLLVPRLNQHKQKSPLAVIPVADPAAWQGWRLTAGDPDWRSAVRGRGDSLILDFGTHGVGTITLELEPTGINSYDSPLRLRFLAGELPAEVADDTPFYGTLSQAWIQEEVLNIDLLPNRITLSRRYAFRYLRIDCPAFSGQYRIKDLYAVFTTSADDRMLLPAPAGLDPELAAIDRVGLLTLRNCMQQVLEDGPKRDRRLWLGDLKLQALVNAVSYRDFDLIERCLYLLASAIDGEGIVPGSVFDRPHAARGCDTLDYALLLGPTLLDHCKLSGRLECAENLYELALHQLEYVRRLFDRNGLMTAQAPRWAFIDHLMYLDRQAPFTGVYIYSLEAHAELAKLLGDYDTAVQLNAEAEQRRHYARKHHYDPKTGLVFSGEKRQCSYASQIWMILSGTLTSEEGRRALENVTTAADAIRPVSPYLWHYYLEAAFHCGMDETAWQFMRDYWGGMVRHGADTFWEVYIPEDPLYSPYRDYRLNSTCHAWSCTPSWFIRNR